MPKYKEVFRWNYDEHGSKVLDAIEKVLDNMRVRYLITRDDDDNAVVEAWVA